MTAGTAAGGGEWPRESLGATAAGAAPGAAAAPCCSSAKAMEGGGLALTSEQRLIRCLNRIIVVAIARGEIMSTLPTSEGAWWVVGALLVFSFLLLTSRLSRAIASTGSIIINQHSANLAAAVLNLGRSKGRASLEMKNGLTRFTRLTGLTRLFRPDLDLAGKRGSNHLSLSFFPASGGEEHIFCAVACLAARLLGILASY